MTWPPTIPAMLATEPTDRSTAPLITKSASGTATTPNSETASAMFLVFRQVRKLGLRTVNTTMSKTKPSSVPFLARKNCKRFPTCGIIEPISCGIPSHQSFQ